MTVFLQVFCVVVAHGLRLTAHGALGKFLPKAESGKPKASWNSSQLRRIPELEPDLQADANGARQCGM